jgi:serine/threonine protein kinase
LFSLGLKPFRFVILEFLGGGTLSRKLNYTYRDHKNYGISKFPQEKTFEYATKLADALAYIHERFHMHVRLFHRDLKSDNIAFTRSGEIKLFDFGLCEFIRKAQIEDAVFKLSSGVGSWRYTAPEVLNHDYYNHKSDVYGFSIIFYHMLTGKHPIDNGYNKTETYINVVENGWRPHLRSIWPTRLNRLFARAWNYDIRARPNMPEIVEELKFIQLTYPDIEKVYEGKGVMVRNTLYVQ